MRRALLEVVKLEPAHARDSEERAAGEPNAKHRFRGAPSRFGLMVDCRTGRSLLADLSAGGGAGHRRSYWHGELAPQNFLTYLNRCKSCRSSLRRYQIAGRQRALCAVTEILLQRRQEVLQRCRGPFAVAAFEADALDDCKSEASLVNAFWRSAGALPLLTCEMSEDRPSKPEDESPGAVPEDEEPLALAPLTASKSWCTKACKSALTPLADDESPVPLPAEVAALVLVAPCADDKPRLCSALVTALLKWPPPLHCFRRTGLNGRIAEPMPSPRRAASCRRRHVHRLP